MSEDLILNISGTFGNYQICLAALYYTLFLAREFVTDGSADYEQVEFTYHCTDSMNNNTCPCANAIYFDVEWKEEMQKIVSPINYFNLICERAHLMEVKNKVSTYGKWFGFFFTGIITDRFGRKHGLYFSITCLFVSCLAIAFIPLFWAYVIFYLPFLVFSKSIVLIVVCLLFENTDSGHRFAVAIFGSLFIFISMCLGEISYIEIFDYREFFLSFGLAVPMLLIMFFLPMESARWLILARKRTEAVLVLEELATFNRRTKAGIIKNVEGLRDKLDEYVVDDVSFKTIFVTLFSRYILKVLSILTVLLISLQTLDFYLERTITKDMQEEYQAGWLTHSIFHDLCVGLLLPTVSLPFTPLSHRTSVIIFGIGSSLSASLLLLFRGSIEVLYENIRMITYCCTQMTVAFLTVYRTEVTPTSIRATMLFIEFTIQEYYRDTFLWIVKDSNYYHIVSYCSIFTTGSAALLLFLLPDPKNNPLISTLGEEQVFVETPDFKHIRRTTKFQ